MVNPPIGLQIPQSMVFDPKTSHRHHLRSRGLGRTLPGADRWAAKIAFGRPFIANPGQGTPEPPKVFSEWFPDPDLVERFRRDGPYNPDDHRHAAASAASVRRIDSLGGGAPCGRIAGPGEWDYSNEWPTTCGIAPAAVIVN